MLLCESDAKFKYCPLLKTRDDKMKFCLGAMCMLWRWAGPAGAEALGYCGAGGAIAAAALLNAGEETVQRPIEDY